MVTVFQRKDVIGCGREKDLIMLKIGIMQGRLLPLDSHSYQVFPKTTWKDEFNVASELGFDSMELLFDAGDFRNNPLLDGRLLFEIRRLAEQTNISVESVCADYFRLNGLININNNRCKENFTILESLITHCSQIGIRSITIPFMDETKISNENDMGNLKNRLSGLYGLLKKKDMVLSFETDLDAKSNTHLMKIMNCDNIKMQYDIGNAAGWGFDILDALHILKQYIAGIHIKDKDSAGNNVLLGTGIVDVKKILPSLRTLPFCKTFILEAAMGDDPIGSARTQLTFVRDIVG
jgi:L-ribulose-5-phosphate 3-epimerase UlaE